MEKIKVGDIDIACEVQGSGHPLVMIQGLTATMDWWEPGLMSKLATRYKVVTFDNRGAGRTETPDGEFSIDQMAADTLGLMDALGIDTAYVLGYSMGGMIAQELALLFPERVDKLVLCVTYCGGEGTVFANREVLAKLVDRSGTVDDLMERFLSLMFTSEWMAEHADLLTEFKRRYLLAPTPDHHAARQFMATVKFDAYQRLDQIVAPTLVMCGEDDMLVPAENSRTIASCISGARLVEFPDSGHGFIWQHPEEYYEELVSFLG